MTADVIREAQARYLAAASKAWRSGVSVEICARGLSATWIGQEHLLFPSVRLTRYRAELRWAIEGDLREITPESFGGEEDLSARCAGVLLGAGVAFLFDREDLPAPSQGTRVPVVRASGWGGGSVSFAESFSCIRGQHRPVLVTISGLHGPDQRQGQICDRCHLFLGYGTGTPVSPQATQSSLAAGDVSFLAELGIAPPKEGA